MKQPIVLAFSGGLDTSFCVPYLIDQGFAVHTLFVNTGGVSQQKEQEIEQRAYELGATNHYSLDAKQALWNKTVIPLVWANQLYQGKYPTLCADRYLIVEEAIKLCQQLNTPYIAHGCTGMGNDQVRFDLAVLAHGDYKILSPIREIQKAHTQTRQYEIDYLKAKGFTVSEQQNRYSVNENLLGVTISGSEIDQWQEPSEDTYVLCNAPSKIKQCPTEIKLNFENGTPVAIEGESLAGAEILQYLNHIGGQYGIGREIYTGDTVIGLKGRILFEAPGIKLLQTAHKALEEVCLTNKQNQFKPLVAQQWTELVYNGFYFDPLYQNVLACLQSMQQQVTGQVTLKLHAHQAIAVAVQSHHLLASDEASYAQSASWGIEEAMGFIKLYGQSTTTWALVNQSQKKAG
nr:argininosuccinate synthase [Kangiella sp. TOML190]